MLTLLNFLVDPIKVYLHIEEFNRRYNLLHVGISFENKYKILRYDFRKEIEGEENCYITIKKDILDPHNDYISDKIYIPYEFNLFKRNFIKNEELKRYCIFWGETNKTFEEIEQFEKTLNKNYILCVYDCRHYVRKFTKWALNKPTYIWRLHKYIKNNKFNY